MTTTEPITVTLHEDNAGGLTLVFDGRALYGLQDTGSTFADDAEVILTDPGEMANWTLDRVSPRRVADVPAVAEAVLVNGKVELTALTDEPGAAARIYAGLWPDR